jgi:hypothetical protein
LGAGGRWGLPTNRAEVVAGWVEQGQLAICLPFLLEAGYSARASVEYGEMMDELDLLFPHVEIAVAMEDRALLTRASGSRQPEPCDCSLTGARG